ncbi:hypothetical protein RIF23_17730 [Lipingzhangella sp. LS1_29]|uniref:DUF3352 domain-containing protein n=1 Tax=Lipingzhangella rawalii TaxID=2055835 RepID=A0ABU2HA42_9ACTN|nr:hypothetical protein [Lipingzhangella rawalii]MDS1272133.1 hypothetical protein [Lipingzhangella rawalii]
MAAGLGVVLLASTVWASVTVADTVFRSPQPADVLPASTAAFGKVDLQPSATQISDYLEFADRLPESMREEVLDDEDAEVLDPYFSEFDYLDYEQDVQPWVGQQFGTGVWVLEDTALSQEHGVGLANVVAVDDEAAAVRTLDEIEANESEFHYGFRGDFAVMTTAPELLEDYDEQVESSGVLADDERFARDIDRIGDTALATGWADLSAVQTLLDDLLFGMGGMPGSDPFDEDPFGGDPFDEDPFGGDPFDEDPFDEDPFDEDPFDEDPFDGATWISPADEPYDPYADLSGRVVMALHIQGDHLEFRSDLVDFVVEGISSADLAEAPQGVTSLGELPAGSVAAVGGSGLDELASTFWEDNPELFQDGPGSSSLGGWTDHYGVNLPEDFTRMLGSEIAVGITDFGDQAPQGSYTPYDEEDPTFQIRATDADAELLEEILTAETRGQPPQVSPEGDTTVVENGDTGGGQLRDAAMFDVVTPHLDEAIGAAYLDLVSLTEGDPSVEDSTDMGAMGAVLTHSAEENTDTTTLEVRWAPSGN